jgi:small GTP-binding protein
VLALGVLRRGLSVHRGKILVVGAAEAGKSTLIAALNPRAINLSVEGRTVAMDHASLARAGWRLSLVGVPGQARFAPVREALAVGAKAAVWVHKAGGPVDPQTAVLVAALDEESIPYMVVVNHHDGAPTGASWNRPELFPTPRDVISCNLLRPGRDLGRIEDCLWDMVRRSAPVQREE